MRRLIVRFNGGLGNQIFQFAAGLYFSRRNSMLLDIVRPHGLHESHGFARPFQLDGFSLKTTIRLATLSDRLYLSTRPVLRSMQNVLGGITRTLFIEEPTTHRFTPTLLDQFRARTICVDGHWQAAGYAEAVAEQLRDSLQLLNEPQMLNRDYAEAIAAMKCPVSVHIRVGDYALHKAIESDSGKLVSWVLRKSYYRKAIARMRAQYPETGLVVFSDDPVAAQAMLEGEPASLWVKGNTQASAFEELWLMSRCKHHVIANSTFSWWGAWMNSDPNKIVIAPKYWFNTHDSYYPELFPPSWNVIDNLD